MGKSQVSLFFIILLFLVVSVVLYYSFTMDSESLKRSSDTAYLMTNTELLNYIEECARETMINGIRDYGISKESEDELSHYVEDYILSCFDGFIPFIRQGYKVEVGLPNAGVSVTEESVILELVCPIEMSKGSTLVRFNEDIYTLPRTAYVAIDPEKYTRIESTDRTVILEIPPGTIASLEGSEVDRVGIKLLDRNFDNLSNSVLAGLMAFEGLPTGVTFSQPVRFIINYLDKDIPQVTKEEDVRIGYYDFERGIWWGLPTSVDPVRNLLVVETQHFTPMGAVLNCDEGQMTQIPFDYIVRHDCEPCGEEGEIEWYTFEDLLTALGGIDVEDISQPSSPITKLKLSAITTEFENGLRQDPEETPGCIVSDKLVYTPKNNGECYDNAACQKNNRGKCECMLAYYSDEDAPSIVGKGTGKVEFMGNGDSCVFAKDGIAEDPRITQVNTDEYYNLNFGSSDGNNVAINIKYKDSIYCSETEEGCSIPDDPEWTETGEGTQKIRNLEFQLQVTNDYEESHDACIYGHALVELSGFGVLTEGAYYSCTEVDKDKTRCMPMFGAAVTQRFCAKCDGTQWRYPSDADCIGECMPSRCGDGICVLSEKNNCQADCSSQGQPQQETTSPDSGPGGQQQGDGSNEEGGEGGQGGGETPGEGDDGDNWPGEEIFDPDEVVMPESQTPSPKNLVVENKSHDSVGLRWEMVDDAEYYKVYKNGEKIVNLPDPFFTDRDVFPDTEYGYYVTAFSYEYSAMESKPSNQVNVTTGSICELSSIVLSSSCEDVCAEGDSVSAAYESNTQCGNIFLEIEAVSIDNLCLIRYSEQMIEELR